MEEKRCLWQENTCFILKEGRNLRIAVLIGGIAYEIQSRFLKGVMQGGREFDAKIFVFTCQGDIYKQTDHGIGEFTIFDLPDLKMFDGIIYARNTIQNEKTCQELEARILESKVPVISIEAEIGDMPRFYIDNSKAMYDLTSHLAVTHKIKSVVYVAGPDENEENIERLAGVKKACNEHHISFGQDNIISGNYWYESGKKAAGTIIESGKMPDAIICANDDMAIGVFLELSESGIEIGKDVLLTGFDSELDTENLTPSITTIEKPLFYMGYCACKRLALQKPVHSKQFNVNMLYRESCKCQERKNRLEVPKIQTNYINEKLQNVSLAEIIKNMSSDLYDCESIESLLETLKHYISISKFTTFIMCLSDIDEMTTETYPEILHIPLCFVNGVYRKHRTFKRHSILPETIMRNMNNDTYFVLPLHFRKNCFGYCVISGCELPYESLQFQNWIMNISNAIENIRKQDILKKMVSKLNGMWILDTMTGIYNRAGFYKNSDKIIQTCKDNHYEVGIYFVDIDHLKYVNDNFKHDEGDYYIQSVADTLKELIEENQLLMRYGGDEFVVLVQNGSEADYRKFCDEFKNKLQKRENGLYKMSASIGYSKSYVNEDFHLEKIIEQADQEMYFIKKANGGRRDESEK